MTQPTPVFLLGAGASLPAKLPLASALTGQMLDTLRDGTSAQRLLAPVLTYVVGAIVGFEAASGKDPRRLPDIESVVSTVALLRDRDNLEVTPFVDWQENVRGFERSSQPPNRLIRALEEELRGDRRSGTMSARDTAKAIAALATSIATPDRPHVYGQLHEEMVRALDTLLALRDPDATAYLAPLVTFAPKVTVATLNYDVTVEAAAERAGVSHADGTNGWSSTGLLDWQNSQVQLLKLHGSLTWRRLDTRTFAGGPAMPAEFVDARAEYHDAPFLVFGRREKLQAAGPFLQLLEEFRRRLAAVKDLVVIGYSFADPHVNCPRKSVAERRRDQAPRCRRSVLPTGVPLRRGPDLPAAAHPLPRP